MSLALLLTVYPCFSCLLLYVPHVLAQALPCHVGSNKWQNEEVFCYAWLPALLKRNGAFTIM